MSLALAFAARDQGRPDEARAQLRALGAAAARDPLALLLWGSLLPPEKAGEALALFEQAARLAPHLAEAHFNWGVTLQQLGRLEAAVLRYQQALRLDPHHLGTLNNLSDLLRRRGRPQEGLALMQRFLAEGGSPDGMELRMAKLALDSRRLDEAGRWFAAAAAARPDDPMTRWERSMYDLLVEDWPRGWEGYEARLELYGARGLAIFPHAAPRWVGQSIEGRRLLLHREQGLGDMMMFAAAVPGLLAEGAQVHLAMAPSLQRLFEASFPGARCWTSHTIAHARAQPAQTWLAAAGPFDLQAPMASLGVLRMAGGPPAPAPHLRPPPDVAARWADRIEALAPRRAGERRAGLVMTARRPRFSDDGLANGERKSLPPLLAAGLADIPRTAWFGLHDRETAPVLADVRDLPLCDLSPWLGDFAETAGAIAALDVVVSVDTAVAHLAAAMGKPTVIALWFGADWRWGWNRDQAAWYPDAALVRQTRPGDWTPVVQEIVRRLS